MTFKYAASLIALPLLLAALIAAQDSADCSFPNALPTLALTVKRAFPTAEGDGADATKDIDSSWTVKYVV
jgi:hypothetical protein